MGCCKVKFLTCYLQERSFHFRHCFFPFLLSVLCFEHPKCVSSVTIISEGSAKRCSLLVRTPTGYIEHIHHDEKLIPICPTSLTAPGLELEIVTKLSDNLRFL